MKNNLMNRLTKNNLKLNKKRTIVTIIGIVLATSLLMAVATFVTSFQKSLIQYQKENAGDFHYEFLRVPMDEADKIKNNRNVESYYETVGLGYAMLEGGANENKPYIYVEAMDKVSMKHSSLTLKAGRLPENETELVIPNHIKTNGGVQYEIGDTITLELGKRYSEGYELYQENPFTMEEKLETNHKQTYTVVGICDRMSYQEEEREAPGYTAITYLSQNILNDSEKLYDSVNIYTRFTKAGLKNQPKVLSQILGVDEELLEKEKKGKELSQEEWSLYEEQMSSTYYIVENSRLMEYETLNFQDGILSVIFKMSIIVMVIIIFTSAFCISNSFSISITEKMKQYGMLASVGATPRQILRNVYYEAFILGVIAIPIGILCGTMACYVLLKIVDSLMGTYLGLKLIFSPSLLGVLVALLLSIVTIYLSARRPAKKASKVSPIMAISGNGEIKLNPKKLEIPKMIKKMFGVGGVLAYKNRKRNKRKYRVAVISITVSVAMFVALYGFMELVLKSADFYKGEDYSLGMYLEYLKEQEGEKLIKTLENMEEVKEFSVLTSKNFQICGEAKISSEYKYEKEYSNDIFVYSIGKKEYETYVKKLGLSVEKAKEGVILVNNALYYDENNKNVFFKLFDYKVGDSIPIKEQNDSDEEFSSKAEEKKLKVVALTEERPLGLGENYYSNGLFIVSDEWMKKNVVNTVSIQDRHMYINCDNPDDLQQMLVEDYKIPVTSINNREQAKREEQSLYLVIQIFLYGFMTVISLIGITNIFNTITTSMELRSMEFAMLDSIGMTKREFNRMIGLESAFYGGFALIIGLLIGNVLCLIFYHILSGEMSLKFHPPVMGMLMAAAAVILLLYGIMKYSIAQIRKKNIIETIRQENI